MHGSASSSADPEEYFRNAIREGWAEMEASKPYPEMYASALWRYCRVLYQASEYVRAGKLSPEFKVAATDR